MSEVNLPQETLEKLRGFSPIQRVLLVAPGTNQSNLSAYFTVPIAVKVLSQVQDESKVYHRKVNLLAGDRVVCRAISKISVLHSTLEREIQEQQLGIGHILAKFDLRPRFELQETGQDEKSFWRKYSLVAPGIVYNIHEWFPKALFEE